MQPVFRNKVQLTSVSFTDTRQFAFGIILEKEPRQVFIPHWIVKAFNIHKEDLGYDFDCLFIEQEGKSPMVIGVVHDSMKLTQSVPVGRFEMVAA